MFANQYTAPTAEFGVDRRPTVARQGAGLFAELWMRVQGARTHPYGLGDKDASITWNGYAAAPQSFAGFQGAIGDGLAYRNDGYPTIDTGLVQGPMGDPARRIFAQRLARRSAIGGL